MTASQRGFRGPYQASQAAAIMLFGVALGLSATGTARAVGTMTVIREVRHDVSPPLRTLARVFPFAARGFPHQSEPVRRLPLPQRVKAANALDLALQSAAIARPLSIALVHDFQGLGAEQLPNTFSDQVEPPDTNGAVGTTQYVQWVNSEYAVFDKSTGKLISGPTDGNALWLGFGGPCQDRNDGDGIVLFDKLAKRWIITQFALGQLGTPSESDVQCVLVSTTPDARGSYNRYAFTYNGVYLNDYPKMAVWPDAYYITFNMFSTETNLIGADACAYDRIAMINGRDTTPVCFQQNKSISGLLPSDLDGSRLPPTGAPNYMINLGDVNSLNVWKFHVDFANADKSTFTGPTVVTVLPFTPLCFNFSCVTQLDTWQVLDPLSDRLMYRLAYRNYGSHESLVVNHSVAAGASGGIRWYEITNPASVPKIVQQGTFSPDDSFRWMGSIAMDRAGDMALGYSESSHALYPSIAVTGRTPNDPQNTMEREMTVVKGSGSQTGTNDSSARWGDYSAMQLDPADDCTFWYTQEYYPTPGDYLWTTRILSLRFPNC